MQRLDADVRHYDWGDPDFIAKLQRREPSGRPEAELWIGAHRIAPSRLIESGDPLDQVIAADPVGTLGPTIAAEQGQLPFLVKVLAAAHPLSIQTHPSRAQAVEGFAREESAGVPIDSRERVYRDTNHKPELICALTSFEAKCGFRAKDQTAELFRVLGPAGSPVLRRLEVPGLDIDVLSGVLRWLLRLPPHEAAVLADDVVRASSAVHDGPYAVDLAWSEELARIHPGDIGVVVALLLNHVVLEPGEALFLAAGNLHSYLRGAGLELMANSDNVVRCGLTTKHIDSEELLRVVDCTPAMPQIQRASGPMHRYQVPVAEFELHRYELGDPWAVEVCGPEILVLTEGQAELSASTDDPVVVVHPGQPVWVPASDRGYEVRGSGTLFRATVGSPPSQ